MAKSVKRVVTDMNKDISRREASRIADKYRKSLRRELAREIKETSGVSLKPTKSIEEYARTHKVSKAAKEKLKEIESSYSQIQAGTKQKIGYDYNVKKAYQSTSAYAKTLERQNKAFQHQMNQATKKGGVSMLSAGKVKGFYMVNTDIFTGTGDSRLFNKRIMDKYGINKLEDVFNLLTDEQLDYKKFGFSSQKEFDKWYAELDKRINITARREALQAELKSLENRYKVGGTTEDDTYNNENEEQEKTTSPPEANRIISKVAIAMNNA